VIVLNSIDFNENKVEGRGPCEQLVSPEPEITVQAREQSDEFLVLACDGIWDVMNNEELCDFVRHQLTIHANLETVCSSIIDTCLHKVCTFLHIFTHFYSFIQLIIN
jgi:protein phosphatase 1B